MNQKHPRRIRSFVRRAGRLTPSQARALELAWPEWGIDYDGKAFDMPAVFSRDAPIVLEIGFGNGDTLVEQAAADPERDYIGIEVHEPGIGHCLLRIEDQGISNLRLIAHDAVEVLKHSIADESLSRVNIYFPDPWPKKRHHKRRLLQPTFLALIAGKLTASGELRIATDWANYAEHIDEVLAGTDLFTVVERREHTGEAPLDRPTTKFERRGLRHGHAIWDWDLARH